MLHKKIHDIAKRTRNEFKPFIYDNSHAFEKDFCCACAVCSYALNKILIKNGFDSKFVIGEYLGDPHAFVICEGYIVDITATQFKRPPIHIVDYPDFEYTVKYITPAQLKRELSKWPYEQKPFSYKKDLEKIIKKVTNDKNL